VNASVALAPGSGRLSRGQRPHRTPRASAIGLASRSMLNRNADAIDGFCHILGAALGHLTANIAPTLGGDPEGLHQMRIALRTARATLRLFAPLFDASMVASFDFELQSACRAFGNARDWDVFCLETLPAATRALPAARLTDLDPFAQIARAASHRAIEDRIRGPEFAAVLRTLADWAQPGSGNTSRPTIARVGKSLSDLAPHLLGRVARKTIKRGRHVTRLSPEDLHRFRKALDRLCDDSIALGALFPDRRVAAYRARCVALQGALGAANDAVVAQALGLSLLLETRPELAAPVEALLGWSRAHRTAALVGLRQAKRDFRWTEPFWS